MHSFGAIFCEVRVNAVTGETRVDRVLGSYDCGRIINPKTAASQFRGGIIMGIGLALMEDTEFDERTGRIMNPSLAEYHVPVHMDVPGIEVMWTDIPDPHAPAGARGIGEIGITGVAAAIANAIYNATGRRVRDLLSRWTSCSEDASEPELASVVGVLEVGSRSSLKAPMPSMRSGMHGRAPVGLHHDRDRLLDRLSLTHAHGSFDRLDRGRRVARRSSRRSGSAAAISSSCGWISLTMPSR